MSDVNILLLLASLLCVGLSFLFSGMETGVLALNRFRIRQLTRSGDRRAVVLQNFLQNPEDFLWTILVGNTVVNFVIFSLGFLQLQKGLGHRPVLEVAVFLVGIFLFYIVCGILAPEDSFPALSEPAFAGACISVPLDSRVFVPVGPSGGVVFAWPASLDRWTRLHRASIWQSGRIAVYDAGSGARFDA